MVQIPFQYKEEPFFTNGKRPILLYAGHISEEPEWAFPSHKHDDLSEIIYISEGEGQFIINNQLFLAKQGDILIYNQGVLHEEKSNAEKPLKTYFCGIGNLHIDGAKEGCMISQSVRPVVHADKYSYKVESYISHIFEELNSQVLGYEEICQNLLISLIILIFRIINIQHIEPNSTNTGTLGYKIKEYIDKNYTCDIPLSEIANQLYISPHYLSHIFKDELGYAPINYLIHRRIGEAKKLLLTTKLSVQEISRQVGYENASYFSIIFKKVAGEAPSQYRKTQLGSR